MVIGQVFITQATAQVAVDVLKATVQAKTTAKGESSSGARNELTSIGPKLGGHALKPLSFSCGSVDRQTELKNFILEVNNKLKTYSINQTEKYQL